MKSANYYDVCIDDGFLHNKQALNENVTINEVYKRFYETGRVEAFDCNWKEGMDKQPHIFWDSDIAKWMESAAYILKNKDDEFLESRVEELIDKIEKNQGDDGYFNTYFTVCDPDNRFTHRGKHELYCAGHLIEAAVAYYESTKRDRFLKCMIKYAEYIEKVFMIDKSAKFVTPGHEEIELALIRLYRCTKNRKYLDMAMFFLDNRGLNDPLIVKDYNHNYDQSHAPVREQKEAVGHAVRACYLYCAMADAAYELGDKELFNACKDLFNDIVNKKMYITGGIGSTTLGEAFTIPYDLRNDKAYTETCASIGMMFFAERMLQLENKAIYADVIEKELYNGMLSGLSLNGKGFFYENPLEINLKNYTRYTSTDFGEEFADKQRKEVFSCSCCPPNITRVLATLGQYIYGYDNNTIFVNQFTNANAKINNMVIKQTTNYPNDGIVKLECENVDNLYIRIPGWCSEYKLNCPYIIKDGYAYIKNPPSSIEVEFVMKPTLIESNVNVWDNCGKVAMQCGPIVYCVEGIDNSENIYNLYIDKNLDYTISYNEYFGLNVITANGYYKIKNDALYSVYNANFKPTNIKFIPYSCFANRGESNMLVWINVL